MSVFYINSQFGAIRLAEENGFLTGVEFVQEGVPELEALPRKVCETPLLAETEQQLNEYFSGLRKSFSLPLAPVGTPFQKSVWALLEAIPYGETRTYAQLAAALGKPKAARAVGGACHRNPIGILIPCHRVIGTSGALTGYAGGLDAKEALLALEAEYRG